MSDIDQFSVTARRINKGMSQDPYLMGKTLTLGPRFRSRPWETWQSLESAWALRI
jgi:hypothetical protein